MDVTELNISRETYVKKINRHKLGKCLGTMLCDWTSNLRSQLEEALRNTSEEEVRTLSAHLIDVLNARDECLFHVTATFYNEKNMISSATLEALQSVLSDEIDLNFSDEIVTLESRRRGVRQSAEEITLRNFKYAVESVQAQMADGDFERLALQNAMHNVCITATQSQAEMAASRS